MELEHRWLGGACIDNLCSTCSYVLTEGSKTLTTCLYSKRVSCFTGGLAKYRPTAKTGADAINILLFGFAGSGKSSFLASITSTLSPGNDVLQGVCPIGSTSEHGTTTLRKYPMPGLNVNLWDTWGLTPDTYNGGELTAIVQGLLPGNWEMGEVLCGKTDVLTRARASAAKRRMHAVLVFLPCASMQDDTEMASLRVLLNDVKKAGLSPIFLLARSDEQVKQENQAKFRSNPNASGFPELEAMKKLAVSKINVPMARVHYSVPYTAELKKTFEIDRLLFKTFELALKSADSFMEFSFQPHAGDEKYDFDDDGKTCPPPYTTTPKATPKPVVKSPPPVATPPPAAAPPVDMAQLQSLVQMFKDGLLSKEQFEKAKDKMFP